MIVFVLLLLLHINMKTGFTKPRTNIEIIVLRAWFPIMCSHFEIYYMQTNLYKIVSFNTLHQYWKTITKFEVTGNDVCTALYHLVPLLWFLGNYQTLKHIVCAYLLKIFITYWISKSFFQLCTVALVYNDYF